MCECGQGCACQDAAERMSNQRIRLVIGRRTNRSDKTSNDLIEGFVEGKVAKVAHTMSLLG